MSTKLKSTGHAGNTYLLSGPTACINDPRMVLIVTDQNVDVWSQVGTLQDTFFRFLTRWPLDETMVQGFTSRHGHEAFPGGWNENPSLPLGPGISQRNRSIEYRFLRCGIF
jgi:hypothetical protein